MVGQGRLWHHLCRVHVASDCIRRICCRHCHFAAVKKWNSQHHQWNDLPLLHIPCNIFSLESNAQWSSKQLNIFAIIFWRLCACIHHLVSCWVIISKTSATALQHHFILYTASYCLFILHSLVCYLWFTAYYKCRVLCRRATLRRKAYQEWVSKTDKSSINVLSVSVLNLREHIIVG